MILGELCLDQEVVKEVRGRQRDQQLVVDEHEGVSQVWRHHREERRLQQHEVQEPELQGGLLLGLSWPLGSSHHLVVQLQQVSLLDLA